MRTLGLIVTCFALALVVAVPATAATTKPCSGTFYHGFFSGLRATGVSCPTARRVVRRWMKETGFDRGKGANPGITRFGAWTCQLRIRDELGVISCRDGARRVAWHGQP
jgi:hypothetical protein